MMAARNAMIQEWVRRATSGAWTESALVQRLHPTAPAGQRRWVRPVVREMLAALGTGARPPAWQVAARVASSERFGRALAGGKLAGSGLDLPADAMWPARGPAELWPVPSITRFRELADMLDLEVDELNALVAPWLFRANERTSHYRHRWIAKADGHQRLIEIPKPRLMAAQRQIKGRILEAIPVHEACVGFRLGFSIHDHVRPHAGQEVVIKMDLEDFFPSIGSGRILRIFLHAGYPERIAQSLTRLTTNQTPLPVLAGAAKEGVAWLERKKWRRPHLPQGAPTSPLLANLAAFRLDRRLAELAANSGLNYTRYADDLLFSGGRKQARNPQAFIAMVMAVAIDCGFEVNPRKTRVMGSHQRQKATGVILNERPNIDRREFDRLKAILHNARLHGLESQNRDRRPDFRACLEGRISWVESLNPARGQKLRAILDQAGD